MRAPGAEAVLLRHQHDHGRRVGNVVGRLLHGHVVDFIQLHYGGWYFPSFNLADSAITLGAICLILDKILRVRRSR